MGFKRQKNAVRQRYSINTLKAGGVGLHAKKKVFRVRHQTMCPPPPQPHIPVNVAQVAYVNLQEHMGKTALHFASMNENAAMIRLLISHGADPTIRDHSGRTPRDYTNELSDAYEILRVAETYGPPLA